EAVVEGQDMARAGTIRWDPVRVMWDEELLIRLRAGAIGPGIPPAVEDVAALAAPAPGVTGRLGRGRAVVDDPELVELAHGQQNLVALGVIGHGVDVSPVRDDPRLSPRGRGADVPDAPERLEDVGGGGRPSDLRR